MRLRIHFTNLFKTKHRNTQKNFQKIGKVQEVRKTRGKMNASNNKTKMCESKNIDFDEDMDE